MKAASQSIEVGEKMISAARSVAALVIARLIFTQQLNPSKLRSKKQFRELIGRIGRGDDSAFEIHVDHVAPRVDSIQHCLERDDPQSAIVLLHTLIESEANTAVRILLRVRGFSHSLITEAIGGTDLKTKLDILLPLLGVQLSQRFRQLAFESQRVRNAIVHFKGKPTLLTDAGNQRGDHDMTVEKANEFFARNCISAIRKELEPFVDECAAQCSELQAAHKLFNRFSR